MILLKPNPLFLLVRLCNWLKLTMQFFSVAQPLHIPFLFQASCARVQKQAVVMIRIHCDKMCNRRKHVFVGTGRFANQALTARLEGWWNSNIR